MKLNNRRTVLIGFAFLSICAFWQLYDTVIPLILRDTFHMGDTLAGQVMALDNLLAVFMLPLFGRFSDKCGKRMPFIVFGTIAAVILMLILPKADLGGHLAVFMIVLVLLLIAMNTYRSPAVALMPDVTPKPLRSKANAIINLMGALGGVYTLGIIKFISSEKNGRNDYSIYFYLVAAAMAVSVALVALFVNEKKLRAEMPEEEAEVTASARLPREMRRSLILILASVSLWYMGYNAVTSAYSKYFTAKWGDLSGAASCLMIATIGAVVSYIPVGFISSKIGRKKMILFGVVLLAACFAAAGMVQEFTWIVYVLFVLVGFAWASINVNSYPMVVEISKGSDVGKYTGYYYTFSMAAQIVTPIVSGYLLEHVGYSTLFPYASGMVALAFVTMLFVNHGDNRPEKPQSVLQTFDTED